MSALGRVVRAGVRRHRTQSIAVGLAALVATTCSVLGGSLLVASEAPFDQAFDGQHGAHLTARFDGTRASADQLAATAHAAGVTDAAGPFRTVTVDPEPGPGSTVPAGMVMSPMTVAGRASATGGVDNITIVQGSWPTRPGEVMLGAGYGNPGVPIGGTLRLPGLPGAPTLTVVGLARSVSGTSDAWVTPDGIAALTAPGTTPGYEMLYRFSQSGTADAMAADRAAVAAAAPARALTGAQSWLDAKQGSVRNTAMFLPFMVAFGLLGLAMSVLVAGNVVAGAVGTATRRIGVLKAIGCTPAQVVRAYVAQALVPATVGTLLGVVVGNVLTVPVLATAGNLYGTNASGIAPWVDVAVAGGTPAAVALVAWASAARAGRLRTVDALAVGRTAGGTRRDALASRAAALAARLPLPRPLSLGLAQPFARPARAAGMFAAVLFGTTAVVFAVGMGGTMNWVQEAKSHDASDVFVHPQQPSGPPGQGAPPPRPTAADPAAVTTALTAQPGAAAYYGVGTEDVTVPGVARSTTVTAFTGDSGWAGYRMVSGRWYQGPGEAVAPATFLTEASVGLGDQVTFTTHGREVTVRIVGEVFDPHVQTDELFTDAATYPSGTAPKPEIWFVKLKPGTDRAAYVTALGGALAPVHMAATADAVHSSGDSILALNSLTATLTVLLVAVAGLGVFNTVVLEIRERTRDTGVTKALGMTPAQTVGTVLASVLLTGAAGGVIGLPLGLLLHGRTVPAMGHSAGLNFPADALDVFGTPVLVLLALGGVVIALLGALLPAVRAARARTADALRAE
ncbi:ABC transporter permease [Kitasatospora sp. SUK 42]|uniref:ABC transporter permease n=1 Tax=Kitasatospora sp. SUK 42 TaxID=1588882 RepID=UPI0018CA879F|nr:ABC transporter permease [Kitasatospora sp. SUK 42]MBV2155171.1 ABC transporter permease [Kitasatospora sp. SUK 42]